MLTVGTGALAGAVEGLQGVADLLITLLLVGLLISKEIATSVPGPQARAVARILDVGLAPLALLYAAIVAVRLLRILD